MSWLAVGMRQARVHQSFLASRVLAGEIRDPLVGRDVLVGCAAGPLLAVIALASLLLPEWLGLAPDLVPADVLGVAYSADSLPA